MGCRNRELRSPGKRGRPDRIRGWSKSPNLKLWSWARRHPRPNAGLPLTQGDRDAIRRADDKRARKGGTHL